MKRLYRYVSDLIDGIYKLAMSNELFPTNIGNPHEITILEFAEKIREATVPGYFQGEELLDWSPEIELAEGLKTTMGYFKKEFATMK
jgi:dTDP-glucose 4,6-dehydratase